MRTAKLLLVSLCLTVAASVTSAQNLNGQWFKATATGVGVSVDGEGQATKAKFMKITQYMRFFTDEGFGDHAYNAETWVEDSTGNWFPLGLGVIVMLDQAETFVSYSYLTFYVPSSVVVSLAGKGGLQGFDVQFVGTSKVKVKNEVLKSASIKSTGSIAQGAYTDDGDFVGTAKVSLTLIAESKLPFNPNIELAPPVGVEVPSWRKPEVGQPVAGSADVTVSQH